MRKGEKETKKEKEFLQSQEVGQNVAYSQKEREEDVLEILYQWYREEHPANSEKLCDSLDLGRREVNGLLRKMAQHGYLEAWEPGEEIKLTAFGKAQGAECLARHQSLTQFLEMVCGVDEKTAEENACRMEHVISKEIVQGFSRFIRYGDVFERSIRNSNLRFLYETGEYRFYMSLYRAGVRYPRILADETEDFESILRLEVGEEASSFWLKKRRSERENILWYCSRSGWKRAEERQGEYRLPTEIFVFSFVPDDPIIEGESVVALTQEDKTLPSESDFREINVHIWQEGNHGTR